MILLYRLLLTKSKPLRLGLALLAAYAIYRAGHSIGEFAYYLQH